MNLTEAPVRWCFTTLGCIEFNLAEVAALARRFGINEVEFRGLEGRLDLPVYFGETFGTPSALKTFLEKSAITVPVMDTSYSLTNTSQVAREELLGFAEWADGIGTPWLRVFDGWIENPADWVPVALGSLDWWRKIKAERGIRAEIIVETHDFLFTGEAIQGFQAALERPVGILWDTHHTWVRGTERPLTTWNAIAPWVRHIHLKDSRVEPPENNRRQCQLGEGDFPMGQLIPVLEEGGYRASWSLEWERKWHPYLPVLETALERLKSWGRNPA